MSTKIEDKPIAHAGADSSPRCAVSPGSASCAALLPGERWGAYWKHPDGWMRLYPPTADELAIAEMRKPDPTPWA